MRELQEENATKSAAVMMASQFWRICDGAHLGARSRLRVLAILNSAVLKALPHLKDMDPEVYAEQTEKLALAALSNLPASRDIETMVRQKIDEFLPDADEEDKELTRTMVQELITIIAAEMEKEFRG
jgi:hypothetical protein